MRNSLASRPILIDLAAAGGLLALVLAFFWRTLIGDVYQPADGGDLVSFLYPTYKFAARSLADGALPLWNPHLYGGAPFIEDIQAGFLYLPNLALFLLWPDFPYVAMQWLAVLHLWWAGLGAYILIRSLHVGGEPIHPLAAFFGGVIFAFCDPLLLHLGNLNLIAVLAWFPWVLAAYHRALERRSLRWAAIAALLFALGSYAGHAQSTILIGMALAVYTVAWTIFNFRPQPHQSSPDSRSASYGFRQTAFSFVLLAATGILAALLLAPILLPSLEGVRASIRTDFTYQESVAYSLAPAQLVGFLSPGFFGRGPALHWSLWDRVELPYLGIPALLMAIAALWIAPASRRRDLYPWLILAIFGLLVALGIYGILHGVLTAVVPFFDQLRAPARTLILFALAGSVLAACGLDLIMRMGMPVRSGYMGFLKWGAILLAGVFVPLLLVALLITQESDELFLRASIALLAMALAALSWLLTWLLIAARTHNRITSTLFATLMIALLFLELAAAGAYTDISSDDPTVNYRHPEIEAHLRADTDLYRIDTLTDIADLWQPDTAALLGFEDVGGIANPLMRQDWATYWESTGGRNTQAYNLLNVKYLIARDGTSLPDNWTLALDAPNALSLWENTAFIPRAWFVPQGGDPAIPDTSAAIALTARNANTLTATAIAPAEGMLVFSQLWNPNWRAVNNGDIVPTSPQAGFVAMPLEPGVNEITLTYTAPHFQTGLWLALLGILLALAAVIFNRPQSGANLTA